MNTKLPLSIILVISCCYCFFSCGNNKADVNLRVTHAENKKIEAIYTSRLDSLRPLWDSLCVFNHDEMLDKALDSIIKERLEEEELLRSRSSQ